MRKCVVHIGMHKTGSTAIQNSLWQQDLGSEVRYADLGQANHSVPLATAFRERPWDHPQHVRSGADRDEVVAQGVRVREMLERELSRPEPVLVLSAESLVTLRRNELSGFAAWLGERAESVLVVGYVRPAKQHMESLLQQLLKTAGARPIPALFPCYRRKLEPFDQIFGRHNVLLRKYEPAQFENGCVVHDFCRQLGLGPPPRVERANTSLSRDAAALLYLYRWAGRRLGMGRAEVARNQRLIGALRTLRGAPLQLDAALVRGIAAQRRDEIDWVEARIGANGMDGSCGGDAPDAISAYEELLELRPAMVEWLACQVGQQVDKGQPDRASLVGWLDALAEEPPTATGPTMVSRPAPAIPGRGQTPP